MEMEIDREIEMRERLKLSKKHQYSALKSKFF